MNACAAGVEPMIAMGREAHHLSLAERFADAPPAPEHPTTLAAMRHRLQTKAGKKRYVLGKQTPEPVFGIHQVGAWVLPVPAARPRQGARRMEPCDHGVEHEADVRPGRGELRQDHACFASLWCVWKGRNGYRRERLRPQARSRRPVTHRRLCEAGANDIPHQTSQTNPNRLLGNSALCRSGS